MDNSKDKLHGFLNELKGMEERARGLQNQNLVDVIAAAYGRVKQISEHADLELIDARKDQAAPPTTREEAIKQARLDNDADPEGTARLNHPHLFREQPELPQHEQPRQFPQPRPFPQPSEPQH